VQFWSGKSARRVGAGSVLDILAVFSNQGWTELCKFLPELWDDFGADQVFNRCFGAGIRVNVYVKLPDVS